MSDAKDKVPPTDVDYAAARHLATPFAWEDLVLDAATRRQVGEIVQWIKHGSALMEEWGMARRFKPGLRSLFFGPPGTGKTLAALLIAKQTGLDLLRVDLAEIVSEYIGETEKNLRRLFDGAADKHAILLFDEAGALFGKRTESHNSNDRAANQQTAYLLQRIEDFPGVIILETNLRSHLDETFARRFQSAIEFRLPTAEERLLLWRGSLAHAPLTDDVDLEALARHYALSGGGIVRAVRHACFAAVTREPPKFHHADLLAGVQRALDDDAADVR